MRSWTDAVGLVALAATLLLLSPGTGLVRADADEPGASGSSRESHASAASEKTEPANAERRFAAHSPSSEATCEVPSPGRMRAAVARVVRQIRREAGPGASSRDVVPLSGRGYNYAPPPSRVSERALELETRLGGPTASD